MKKMGWIAIGLALLAALPILTGCAATLKNYDQVGLGMNPEQVKEIAGDPHRIIQIESTGEGTLIPMPAGKEEIWIYCCGMIQFHDGKVVAKGQRVKR
jgi:hypothetical protein